MTVDTQRVAQLLAEGKSLREIATELEGPTGPSPEEREFERLRGAMHGAATPPGQEPTGDLWVGQGGILPTFRAAQGQGMRREEAFDVAISKLFAAAADENHPHHSAAIFDPQRWRAEQGWHQTSGAGR